MRFKTLATLAAVLAALVIMALAAALLTRPPKPALLAPATLPDDAVRIEVEGPGGKLALERGKAGWTAAAFKGYPADAGMLKDVLGKLANGTVSGPLTEDPERYALFGIGASSATHLRVATAQASPVLEFYVGKDGPDYPSAFVRLAGQAGVVQLSGVAAFELSRPPGEWLDKKVAPGPADAVTRVSVRGAKGNWELILASGAWTLGGQKLPADRAETIVRPLREAAGALEAETVVSVSSAPAAKETGLDHPDIQVTAEGSWGRVAFAAGGKKDAAGRRYVRKEKEDRVVYLVADWKLDALRKSAAELLKK